MNTLKTQNTLYNILLLSYEINCYAGINHDVCLQDVIFTMICFHQLFEILYDT
jgi:hypothetical protein